MKISENTLCFVNIRYTKVCYFSSLFHHPTANILRAAACPQWRSFRRCRIFWLMQGPQFRFESAIFIGRHGTYTLKNYIATWVDHSLWWRAFLVFRFLIWVISILCCLVAKQLFVQRSHYQPEWTPPGTNSPSTRGSAMQSSLGWLVRQPPIVFQMFFNLFVDINYFYMFLYFRKGKIKS